MTRDEVLELIREHLADELELDPGAHHGGHALPQGPASGLARPLHAGAGARGHLRRQDVRRGGGADPDRAARRSTSCWPTTVRARGRRRRPRAGILTAARAARPAGAAAGRARPAGGHARVVGRASAPTSYERLAFLGDSVLGLAITTHLYPRLGELRRRAADQDPRAGGLGSLVPRRRGAAGDPRAAAGGGAGRVRGAGDRGAGADRAGAGVGDRGGDRRVLPGVRLRARPPRRWSRRSRRRSSSRSSARPTSSPRCRSASRAAEPS